MPATITGPREGDRFEIAEDPTLSEIRERTPNLPAYLSGVDNPQGIQGRMLWLEAWMDMWIRQMQNWRKIREQTERLPLLFADLSHFVSSEWLYQVNKVIVGSVEDLESQLEYAREIDDRVLINQLIALIRLAKFKRIRFQNPRR